MTLKDFRIKYKLKVKDICKACNINAQRLWVLEQGGCHRAISRIAPLIEAMVEDCKDKIYVPPKEDTTIHYKRVEKIPFTEEEIELVKQQPYMLPSRTLHKVMNGHMFSKKVHDDIVATLKGESNRYKGGAIAYRKGG